MDKIILMVMALVFPLKTQGLDPRLRQWFMIPQRNRNGTSNMTSSSVTGNAITDRTMPQAPQILPHQNTLREIPYLRLN